MITEPSTIVPKSIAPKLMRFAEMPKMAMPRNANRSESGMVQATTRAARQLPRNASRTTMTSEAPMSRLSRTVPIEEWMTLDWS